MKEFSSQKTYGVFLNANSRQTIERLKKNEIQFIEFPAIEIEKTQLNAAEIELIKNITAFNWLVFTQPIAAEIFLDLLTTYEVELFELDNLRIAAFGELTSDNLRFQQIHSDIIFTSQNSNLFNQIRDYTANDDEFSQLKILVIGEIEEENNLELHSQEVELDYTNLRIFKTLFRNENPAKYLTLLKGGAVEEIIINSAEDIIALRKIYSNFEQHAASLGIKIWGTNPNLQRFVIDNGFAV